MAGGFVLDGYTDLAGSGKSKLPVLAIQMSEVANTEKGDCDIIFLSPVNSDE
jgi:hypothetical protein